MCDNKVLKSPDETIDSKQYKNWKNNFFWYLFNQEKKNLFN